MEYFIDDTLLPIFNSPKAEIYIERLVSTGRSNLRYTYYRAQVCVQMEVHSFVPHFLIPVDPATR